jgi:quercetin dioxygenase-like cupin family protein
MVEWFIMTQREMEMVKKGDCINNPITGERVEFLQTSEDTDGGMLQIMLTARPSKYVGAQLVHPVQEVRFNVKSGTLKVNVAGDEHVLTSGQELVIPRDTPHAWWNGGEDDLKTLIEFHPALQMEDLFTTLFALARAGKTNKMGVPNLFQMAAMSRKYKYEVFLARPSLRIQKLIFLSTAWLAWLIGYQADYPYQRDTIVLESGTVEGELATVPVDNRCS